MAGTRDALAAGDKAKPNEIEQLGMGGIAHDATENADALLFFAVDATGHFRRDRSPSKHGGIGRDEAFFTQRSLNDGGLEELGEGLRAAFVLGFGKDGGEIRLPFAEEMREESFPILEMPVEAALGDAQVAREEFDADFCGAASEESEARRAEPIVFGEGLFHTVAYGTAGRESCQYGGVWWEECVTGGPRSVGRGEDGVRT
jgi:hypothetical protein